MERMVAELVDMVGRCSDDGWRGYGSGTATAASAMAEGSEGEALGKNGRVQGVEGATWRSTSSSRGEAASRWRRGELALVGVTSLPAWRGRSSWLARAIIVLGRQVGQGMGLAR